MVYQKYRRDHGMYPQQPVHSLDCDSSIVIGLYQWQAKKYQYIQNIFPQMLDKNDEPVPSYLYYYYNMYHYYYFLHIHVFWLIITLKDTIKNDSAANSAHKDQDASSYTHHTVHPDLDKDALTSYKSIPLRVVK